MVLTGEIHITYGIYRKMALSSYGIRPTIGRALPLAFLVIGAVQTLIAENPDPPFLRMGVFFLVIPAFFELMVLISWALRHQAYAQPFRYEFGATGMTERTATGRTDLPWTDVTRVDRWPSTWIIHFRGGRYLRVPRKALAPADRRTLNEFFLANPAVFG
ncbi:YcxB family protein [Actinoplanes sp. NPDC048796]|uniref:YcxB family protein n=1 Tax=unclassified Actinoplanes TaxID=2626549 RepID=UPI0033D78D77